MFYSFAVLGTPTNNFTFSHSSCQGIQFLVTVQCPVSNSEGRCFQISQLQVCRLYSVMNLVISNAHSLNCSLKYLLWYQFGELCKHEDKSSLIIVSLILISFMFYQRKMLLGEIRCWSVLGFTWSETRFQKKQ